MIGIPYISRELSDSRVRVRFVVNDASSQINIHPDQSSPIHQPGSLGLKSVCTAILHGYKEPQKSAKLAFFLTE